MAADTGVSAHPVRDGRILCVLFDPSLPLLEQPAALKAAAWAVEDSALARAKAANDGDTSPRPLPIGPSPDDIATTLREASSRVASAGANPVGLDPGESFEIVGLAALALSAETGGVTASQALAEADLHSASAPALCLSLLGSVVHNMHVAKVQAAQLYKTLADSGGGYGKAAPAAAAADAGEKAKDIALSLRECAGLANAVVDIGAKHTTHAAMPRTLLALAQVYATLCLGQAQQLAVVKGLCSGKSPAVLARVLLGTVDKCYKHLQTLIPKSFTSVYRRSSSARALDVSADASAGAGEGAASGAAAGEGFGTGAGAGVGVGLASGEAEAEAKWSGAASSLAFRALHSHLIFMARALRGVALRLLSLHAWQTSDRRGAAALLHASMVDTGAALSNRTKESERNRSTASEAAEMLGTPEVHSNTPHEAAVGELSAAHTLYTAWQRADLASVTAGVRLSTGGHVALPAVVWLTTLGAVPFDVDACAAAVAPVVTAMALAGTRRHSGAADAGSSAAASAAAAASAPPSSSTTTTPATRAGATGSVGAGVGAGFGVGTRPVPSAPPLAEDADPVTGLPMTTLVTTPIVTPSAPPAEPSDLPTATTVSTFPSTSTTPARGEGERRKGDSVPAGVLPTLPGVPSAPRAEEVTESAITITWDWPGYAAGASPRSQPHAAFDVQWKRHGAVVWNFLSAPVTEPRATKALLSPNTTYVFRVCLSATAGADARFTEGKSTHGIGLTSEFGPESAPITTGAAPPPPPTGVRAVRVHESGCLVRFHLPGNDNGETLTGYSLALRQSGSVVWHCVTPEGELRVFPSTGDTTTTTGGARSLAAAAAAGSLAASRVSEAPPVFTDGEGTTSDVAGATISPGSAGRVHVRARSLSATGTASTDIRPPLAPLSCVFGDGTAAAAAASATTEAGSEAKGAPVQAPAPHRSSASTSGRGAVCNCTVKGLRPDTTYRVCVWAHNGKGPGDAAYGQLHTHAPDGGSPVATASTASPAGARVSPGSPLKRPVTTGSGTGTATGGGVAAAAGGALIPPGSPGFTRELAWSELGLDVHPDDITWDSPRKCLGQGGFGSVYRSALGGFRGKTVAVKEMTAALPASVTGVSPGDTTDSSGTGAGTGTGAGAGAKVPGASGDSDASEQLRQLQQEVTLLAGLSHPNLVQLLGACLRPPRFFFIMEYMKGGSLGDAIHTSRAAQAWSLSHKIAIACQIAAGMRYLHTLPTPVVHRDLKPHNVVLNETHTTAKVCDFGLARSRSASVIMTRVAGSFEYLAPEAFRAHGAITETVDTYSFAVVLNELLSGLPPWPGVEMYQLTLAVAVERQRPAIAAGIPGDLAALICECWRHDAASRPTFSVIAGRLKGLARKYAVSRGTRAGAATKGAPAAGATASRK